MAVKFVQAEPKPLHKWPADVLVFPFRGRGKFILIIGPIVLLIVDVFKQMSTMAGGVGALLLAIIVGGYYLVYQLSVLTSSAGGEDEPPDWPDVTDILSDLIGPFFRVVATVVVSLLPLVVLLICDAKDYAGSSPDNISAIVADDKSAADLPEPAYQTPIMGEGETPNLPPPPATRPSKAEAEQLAAQSLKEMQALERPFPNPKWYWMYGTFMILGMLYLPMALIGVALFQSFEGLNPVMIFSSIIRTSPAYLLACITFIGVYILDAFISSWLSRVSVVLGFLLGGAIWFYAVMVQMRVLGLFFRLKETRLGWFEVAPRPKDEKLNRPPLVR